LVAAIYAMSENFPPRENFGLTSQMRRCAVSVPSNIAEGAARFTTKDKLNFYHIARGSLSELDTQVEIALRLRYLSQENGERLQDLMGSVSRMLQGLIDSHRPLSRDSR